MYCHAFKNNNLKHNIDTKGKNVSQTYGSKMARKTKNCGSNDRSSLCKSGFYLYDLKKS